MSVQKKSYKTKTGIKVKYYAAVYDKQTKKTLTGSLRNKKSDATKDEVDLLTQLEKGKSQKSIRLEKSITVDDVYQRCIFR
ncbi:MAG: hypothetical protein PHD70_13670 [Anaerostipes sp.]|jgi:hypothetical protein|nr:hypothetical protein [Anaerostipes sp.]MDD3747504.1 hypothetical protein [Anaerostipes sp.]